MGTIHLYFFTQLRFGVVVDNGAEAVVSAVVFFSAAVLHIEGLLPPFFSLSLSLLVLLAAALPERERQMNLAGLNRSLLPSLALLLRLGVSRGPTTTHNL